MLALFFDSSALIKRHIREPGSAWVRSLVRPGTPHPIHLSAITAVEVFAAVTRRQRGGTLSAAQAGAILGHFRRDLLRRYVVGDVTPALLSVAMRLARRHGLRAYDAVQLASAIEIHQVYRTSRAIQFSLISADRELNAAATAEGLPVEDPNSHP